MNISVIHVADRVFKVTTDKKNYVTKLNLLNKKEQETKPLSKNLLLLKRELEDYFAGKKMNFKTKIQIPNKTAFSEKVYSEMKRIPYGKTITYGQLATLASSPKASRAIGNICNKNPVPFLIPCHRVISAQGIGGFALGLKEKRHLLALEKIAIN